ncbi:MAG: NAD(P)H-quinone oxidoreductase [Rothia sp. (in: high G+C Gram-positive bacteria)]|uniref:NAD(P)H-quinone oxidoreductase n=1 Tax=Rothia sp. (in: high G+C Gram-positive bacteria) TaxID=1885016 RepID=UPI0026E0766D|nr:NAD(P)H-quinone oxidoreductase [Rothia sp. (in: high G+C Gram-positive bacteria)]MDO5749776.1 NAD(P)H-quinone oxidoreductase [Rothia sp. (in: high G+C Gram-positive bacteria)]
MRAIIEEAHGGPEVLTVSEIDLPQVQEHQVLIKIAAAGLNRADALQRRGHYPPPAGASHIYGLEVSGTIEAIGSQVSGWAVGDQVMALMASGGYAEYVAVDARHIMPIPAGVSLIEAGGIPEVAATVYSNLVTTCGMSLNPADNAEVSVLIHGGSGGIGAHAIQLALAAGARVFATAGSEEKCEFIRSLGRELGADSERLVAINYREESFREVIERETNSVGVNYILDVVGAPYLNDNLHSLADSGHMTIIGLQGGARAELDMGLMLTRRLSVHATSLRSRGAEDKARIIAGVRREVLPLYERGLISPALDSTFDLDRAAAAHEYFDGGAYFGKVLLVP